MDRLHYVFKPRSPNTKCTLQVEKDETSVTVKPSPGLLPGYCYVDRPQLAFHYSENASSEHHIVTEKGTCLSGISKGYPFCTSMAVLTNNADNPFSLQATASSISKENKYTCAESSISSMPMMIKRIPSDTVLSLGEASTITTYSDGDGFSNGVSFSSPQNLENSSASSFCYQFEQKNPGAGSSQENESMALTSSMGEYQQSSHSDGGAHANVSIAANISTEQKILHAYLNYKSFATFMGERNVSFFQYLHSTMCKQGMCICTQHFVLLSHFDNCRDLHCYICWSLKLLCDPAVMQSLSEVFNGYTTEVFSTDAYKGPDTRYSKCVQHPGKRMKKEIAYGVNENKNSASQPFVPIIVRSSSAQRLSDLHKQPEFSVSIHTEPQGNNMKLSAKPIPNSANIDEIKSSQCKNTEQFTVGGELLPPQGSEVNHNAVDINLNGKRCFAESVGKKPDGLDLGILVCTKTSSPAQAEQTFSKIKFSTTSSEIVKSTLDVDSGEGANSLQGKLMGVSLIEFFTVDRIREHMWSLKQQTRHERELEEKGKAVNLCQLCGLDKLLLAPVPIYCSFCGARIKRRGQYYCKEEEFDAQYCFCISCFRQSRGTSITFNGISVAKTMLHRKRNDEETEESWVQCDRCEGWQHQICSLYNDKRDLEGKAMYICPKCCLEEIENGKREPLSEKYAFCARDFPRTPLSDQIEKRLIRRLQEESKDWENDERKKINEVLEAEGLTVRVALSVAKQLKVKEQFLDIFSRKNYPSEFPYRSKVVLLFQKIEGVDVCLFGMYVQEFGSECGRPNQNCVYISYIDSVKYFRPEIKTSAGEALRTFVYHEILIGYLEFCKKQGFTTCYLWACPPLKGEDYILYCHPEAQKTPKSEKLRQWYQFMLGKATKENIVVGVSNIYDEFFVPTGDSNGKVTAARLPYFDGDYWSGAALDLMRNIEKKNGGDYQRELKKIMTKRALKTMGHTNPSDATAKDILLMQKLGQSILPVKEDFMVVHLQFVCIHCREVILSGRRWFCTQCKNYQLCDRCHTFDHDLGGKDTHTAHGGEIHMLSQVTIDDNSFDANEKDPTVDNSLFENRHTFLSFCQRNHFQFDTLRRAKHSSMMVLHHLRNPSVLTIEKMCSICCQGTVTQKIWSCETCSDFTLCEACYKLKGAECHVHQLIQSSLATKTIMGSTGSHPKALLTRQLLDVIQHASQCRSSKDQPCTYPYCVQIKKLFGHANRCTIRASGGCQYCKKAWMGLSMHSRNCIQSDCRIPRCTDLKRHAEWLASQSDVRRRAAILELSR